jgi:VanZ family protein
MQLNKIRSYSAVVLALSFWLLGTIFHLRFSHWLATPIQSATGSITPKEITPWFFALSIISITGFIVFQFRRGNHKYASLLSWIIALGIISLINQTLLTTPLENIHYIQYGIISWLLFSALGSERRTSSFLSIFLLTTFLGIVDEANQYINLAKDYGNYLDFNDFLLNQLGAATGLFIHYGSKHDDTSLLKSKSPLIITVSSIYAVIFLLAGILVSSGAIQFKATELIPSGGFLSLDKKLRFHLERQPEQLGYWHQSFSGGEYYVLSPWEWLLCFCLGSVIFYYLTKMNLRGKSRGMLG